MLTEGSRQGLLSVLVVVEGGLVVAASGVGVGGEAYTCKVPTSKILIRQAAADSAPRDGRGVPGRLNHRDR